MATALSSFQTGADLSESSSVSVLGMEMMKKRPQAAIVQLCMMVWCVMLFALPACLAESNLKIATVDLAYIFEAYNKTRAAEQALLTAEEDIQKERQRLLTELRTLEEAYSRLREESQDSNVPADVRGRKRRDAEKAWEEKLEYEARVQRVLARRDREAQEHLKQIRVHLIEELKVQIAEYARRNEYDLILDSSGKTLNGISFSLFIGDIDITESLLLSLNTGDLVNSEPAADPAKK